MGPLARTFVFLIYMHSLVLGKYLTLPGQSRLLLLLLLLQRVPCASNPGSHGSKV